MSEEIIRQTPVNELDLSLMTTNSLWGSPEISKELKEKLSRNYGEYDENGNLVIHKKELWGLLNFYTRDLRLANIDHKQLWYCNAYLNLASDFLHADQTESFLIALSRVISILELSQSKGGFFRKISNTLRKEQSFEGIEPDKKSLFGFTKKNKGGF